MIKVIFLALSVWSGPGEMDSVRLETINGKPFIIHQVEQGETLYGISRRYGSSIPDILEYNKEADAGLEVGQLVKVPYVARPAKSNAGGTVLHVVAPRETLFSISQAYQVSVEQLKQWNHLTENAISVGQEIIVKKAGGEETMPAVETPDPGKGFHTVVAKETLFSISRDFNVSVSQIKEWNQLTGSDLKIGQVLRVSAPTADTTTPVVSLTPDRDTVSHRVPEEGVIRISENVAGSDEIKESGLAELIEGTEGNRKYLALHRTAPTGTILKVKSELNNREVFVRVVGNLPATGVNDRIIIKISKSAFDRLGAIDPRFRVEVTYYK